MAYVRVCSYCGKVLEGPDKGKKVPWPADPINHPRDVPVEYKGQRISHGGCDPACKALRDARGEHTHRAAIRQERRQVHATREATRRYEEGTRQNVAEEQNTRSIRAKYRRERGQESEKPTPTVRKHRKGSK
jgi:hypothetical protein